MRVLRALLAAQARSTWNRRLRESGAAGPVATLVVVAFVAAILSVPCLGMLWAGLDLGKALATAPRPSTLLQWNAWQALFTVVFAVLGNFRHQPAFTFSQLGRLPITPWALLLAEIPAGLLEVFPILGAAGLVFSNLGLAIRMPAASPVILLLTLQSVGAMLALLFLTGSVRRILSKRRSWALLAGLGILAGAFTLDLGDFRWFARTGAPALIRWLPGSQGYSALLELRSGQLAPAILKLAAVLGVTAALLGLAAWVHQREMALERTTSGFARRRSAELRFGRPAAGIGRLFQKQLLDSQFGRMTFVLLVLLTLPLAALLAMVRLLAEQDGVLTDHLTRVEKLADLPLLGLFLLVVVIMDSQIWMNQFGWDRSGIRTLLLLPIAPRDLLLGKLLGLARYAGLQAVLGALPLIWVYTPTAAEVLAGIGAAGTALVVTAAAGHVFSARFPRAIARDGSANLPLYLSWVPTVLVVMVMSGLTSVYLIAKGLGPWGPPAAFLGVLGGTLALYLFALPALGNQVHVRRERLLQM